MLIKFYREHKEDQYENFHNFLKVCRIFKVVDYPLGTYLFPYSLEGEDEFWAFNLKECTWNQVKMKH